MASDPTQRPDYVFKRDYRSSIRLNYNHWLMKELTGYLIHPAIPTHAPNLRIADLGSGTNIWALEMAAQLPNTVRIDGFDISGDQYTPATSRPDNLHLHIQDCFKPFPSEFVGAFDVVYARFWLCIVNNPDAPDLLRNMVSLLKPGGCLQWLELMALSARAVKSSADSSTTLDQLVSHWHKPAKTKTYDWIEKLPELYREQNLEVIAADRFSFPQHLRHAWHQSLLLAVEDRARTDILTEGLPEDQRMWMSQLMMAFAKGSYIDQPFICVAGKKLVE